MLKRISRCNGLKVVGLLVVERGGGPLKAEVDVWGDPGPGVELMRSLRAAFDPTGIFAPGRFVGGL